MPVGQGSHGECSLGECREPAPVAIVLLAVFHCNVFSDGLLLVFLCSCAPADSVFITDGPTFLLLGKLQCLRVEHFQTVVWPAEFDQTQCVCHAVCQSMIVVILTECDWNHSAALALCFPF